MNGETLMKAMADAIAAQTKTVVADVVRIGDKLLVPENMSIDSAINTLKKKQQEEESLMRLARTFNVFPYEGAIALEQAMKDVTGFLTEVATPGFFSMNPPARIGVQVSLTETKQILWGRVEFHEDGAWLATNAQNDNGKLKFVLQGEYKKKHNLLVERIIARMEAIIDADPFYKGRALTIHFYDDDDKQLDIPSIEFYNFDSPEVDALTYSKHIEQLIYSNVITPITHREACAAAGIPFKRGVLLAGTYGTGKTLLARKVARECVRTATTFIYIKHTSELPEAIQFARQYQPAVIFAEDIDRVMGGQDRTEDIDEVLNTLDGIDSKNTDIMVVLTTNHLDNINSAMLRPGRIDVLVEVTPPDAEAAARLIRVYGRDLVESGTLSRVGAELSGFIPAVIREVVERSKLVHIHRTGHVPTPGSITEDDLLGAALSMRQQMEVLNRTAPKALHPSVEAANILAHATITAAEVRSANDIV